MTRTISQAEVERVARAIALAEYAEQTSDDPVEYPADYSPREIELLERQARAAIAAMNDQDGLREALIEARRLIDQVPIDLSSAHAEICKLQGLDPATHSWPEWTPQANTLRWLEKLKAQIDAALSKGDATR